MPLRYALVSLLVAAACSAQDESPAKTPASSPPPVIAAKMAVPSIASVRLNVDCPDPVLADAKPAASWASVEMDEPAEMEDMGEAGASLEGRGFAPQCTQSTVQIAFSGQGATPAKVAIKELRLLTQEGAQVAVLKARGPRQWRDHIYEPWDQTLLPETSLQASYKLSAPDWNAVSTKVGGNSYSSMFVLEVDVDVGGTTSTVRSAPFAREQEEMIET